MKSYDLRERLRLLRLRLLRLQGRCGDMVLSGWPFPALWRTQVTIPSGSHVSHPGAQQQMIRSGCRPL